MRPLAALVTLMVALPVAATEIEQQQQTPALCSYLIVDSFPHDPDAYTQGLVISDGELFEGTGQYGESSLRRVTLATGVVEQIYSLSKGYFGEGVTDWGDTLIQLTWKQGTGFVYDRETFELLDQLSYSGYGWGLTRDGERLIMSDGTSYLRFWDPETFTETGQVQVSDDQGPVIELNELEYICGEVWANVWQTDSIARIDPTTGQVVAWIDLTGLPAGPGAGVLNGIAYDRVSNRVYVTGKDWSTLYLIELVGCPQRCIFADGFESGDISLWSVSIPSSSQPLSMPARARRLTEVHHRFRRSQCDK
jgi:glutamine cyclotransferase